jgi:plasmid stability protein
MNREAMARSILEAALIPGKTPTQIRIAIRAALQLLGYKPPSKRPRPRKP